MYLSIESVFGVLRQGMYLSIVSVFGVVRQERERRFEHVELPEDSDCVRARRELVVEGVNRQGWG